MDKLETTLKGLGADIVLKRCDKVLVKRDYGYQPWVVWTFNAEGHVFWGHYFCKAEEAFTHFDSVTH